MEILLVVENLKMRGARLIHLYSNSKIMEVKLVHLYFNSIKLVVKQIHLNSDSFKLKIAQVAQAQNPEDEYSKQSQDDFNLILLILLPAAKFFLRIDSEYHMRFIKIN